MGGFGAFYARTQTSSLHVHMRCARDPDRRRQLSHQHDACAGHVLREAATISSATCWWGYFLRPVLSLAQSLALQLRMEQKAKRRASVGSHARHRRQVHSGQGGLRRTAKKVATKVHDLVHPDSAGAVERRVQAGMARQAAREAKLARKEAKKAKLAALKAEWEYEKRPEVMAMRRRERKEEEARLYQERIERERREATEAFYRSEARRKEREEWYFDGTRLRRHKTDD